MAQSAIGITALLKQAQGGDQQALDRVMRLVCRELRQVAGNYIRHERVDHTLQPTALVNEAYLRLFGNTPVDWQNRPHFMRAAARAMRRILVDHARKRGRVKRGGEMDRISLRDSAVMVSDQQPDILLALDESLSRLSKVDQRQAEVVELLYFSGMTAQETARALQVSESTVWREWRVARAWLQSEVRRAVSR